MTKLFDIILSMASEALPVQSGTATGGSTTTLADANHPTQSGYFTGGTLFFLDGAAAGTFTRIDGFDGSVFTFATQTAPGTASHYVAAPKSLSLDDMIGAVNEALATLGKTLADDATLTTVANQEEYTLPTGVSDIRQVEIATSLTTPYNYRPNHFWNEIAGKLRFRTRHIPVTAGYKMRITYRAPHAAVYLATAAINDYVSANWLKWAAMVNLLRLRGNRGHYGDPEMKIGWEEAQGRLQQERKPTADMVIVKLAG